MQSNPARPSRKPYTRAPQGAALCHELPLSHACCERPSFSPASRESPHSTAQTPQPAGETIVLLRHGEKPPTGLGQLTCKGLNRALALPSLLMGGTASRTSSTLPTRACRWTTIVCAHLLLRQAARHHRAHRHPPRHGGKRSDRFPGHSRTPEGIAAAGLCALARLRRLGTHQALPIRPADAPVLRNHREALAGLAQQRL